MYQMLNGTKSNTSPPITLVRKNGNKPIVASTNSVNDLVSPAFKNRQELCGLIHRKVESGTNCAPAAIFILAVGQPTAITESTMSSLCAVETFTETTLDASWLIVYATMFYIKVTQRPTNASASQIV
jgi:hypothetical protein